MWGNRLVGVESGLGPGGQGDSDTCLPERVHIEERWL